MPSGRFFGLSNSALKVVSGKNYSKVGFILEVNNEVVVETWIVKRHQYFFTWFSIFCTPLSFVEI